jgi:hypothetical protein
VPEFLSEAWFDALAAALESLHANASAAGNAGLALGHIVREVPEKAASTRVQNGEVRYTIVLRQDGSASLVRGSTAEADVVLVEDWSTAEAVATGVSSVSDMLSAGKIKLRGDTRALVAGGDLLANIAPVILEALGGQG